MKKKILGLLIALGISIPAFASIAVAPTRIEINANKVKTNYITTAIEVKGDSKEPVRVKAYSGFFTINEKGEFVAVDKSASVYNISKKIRFVPSEFTVAEGKSQKLRVNITGINQLPDGESRAVLYIEDVSPKEMEIDTGRAGIGAQLIVKTRIGVPIYIDKGKFTKEAEIEYLKVTKQKDGLYSEMKVLSKGNSRVRYVANAQIIQGKKLIDEYAMNNKVVGENNYYVAKEKIRTDKIKNSGEYTLRIILSYFDQNGKRKNIIKETILDIQGEV